MPIQFAGARGESGDEGLFVVELRGLDERAKS